MEKIESFIGDRPDTLGVFGYGSGIFKQTGYTDKDKPQLDLILVVDNLKKWHSMNMKLNKGDYSLLSKATFSLAKDDTLKGSTGITYISNIEAYGSVFKYGTIEINDLIHHLMNWDSYYLAGRFQKLVSTIKSTPLLNDAIEMNRKNALMLASYLQEKDEVTKSDILITLCGLSYLGDIRKTFKAEKSTKVKDIVTGGYDKFLDIYDFNTTYSQTEGDIVKLDKEILRYYLKTLPFSLYTYIECYMKEPDEVIRTKIVEYITKLNKQESSEQTIEGIFTNGVVDSVAYAAAKLKKGLKK